MSLRKQEFVEAARALGNRPLLVMRRHALPNIFGPLMVQTSLAIAGAILAETALSFLGLGVQPPTPSWGSTLRIGTGHMQSAPLLSLYPGLQIFATVLGIIRLGDRLRDMLNPRVSG